MSSSISGGPSLPHRTISTIRGGQTASAAPHTPNRPAPSLSFSSPSGLRADEDVVVVELGSRTLRVGFAGDPVPKRTVTYHPDSQRRVGDFRAWDPNYRSDWRKRSYGKPWGSAHELWQLDVREQDLALVRDKLERELRDAFSKYLMIDSKPRKFSLILPPTIPLPLISCALDTFFNRFQAPTISLVSSPVMAAIAAGTRCSLVVDLGWHETTVTGVYEYREVKSWRTIRGGKRLMEDTYDLLAHAAGAPSEPEDADTKTEKDFMSFEECEEVAMRLLWCKRPHRPPPRDPAEGLPTVQEHDEWEIVDPADDLSPVRIRLNSCDPPKNVEIPFSQLADPCETTYFSKQRPERSFDDHELPVHLLVYQALLQLPVDVRAMCMSRIIFTGGCSGLVGLRGRIYDEVFLLIQERGWSPIRGKGVEQYKTNPKLNRMVSQLAQERPIPVIVNSPADEDQDGTTTAPTGPGNAIRELDQVEESIKKDKSAQPPVQGALRVVDSLGPWSGASMAAQLKVPALAVVDRDLWMQHGIQGASRPNDVDVKAQQRQSMGAGGLMRGQGVQPGSWTLGVWGST